VPNGLMFPNWVNTVSIFPVAASNILRDSIGFKKDDVVALYAGNMGAKQGLEVLIDVAAELRENKYIQIVLCGEGSGKRRLQKLASGMPNITFLPLQQTEKLNELLNMADIHLLPQSAEVDDLVMPSKLSGMFASGRPVVATAKNGSQLALVVSGCGIVVAPGDVQAMASAIASLGADSDRRARLGGKARAYAVEHWGRAEVLSAFDNALTDLARK
jgi:colanic acid biosynthesis glycosyl transferase WcaI